MPRWHVVSWIVMGKRKLENEQPLTEADEAAGQSTQKQRLTSNAPSASDASPSANCSAAIPSEAPTQSPLSLWIAQLSFWLTL